MSKIICPKKFRKDSNNQAKIKEELTKNNYDTNHNKKSKNINYKKYQNINWASRKNSKDSSNLSTSNEDISEKKEYNNKYKATASDFKIKYKTELCKNYEMTGTCIYGNSCAYAHGIENLRSKVTNTTAYRSKKCKRFFEKGYCPYGSRCQFQHQLKNNIVNNPYDDNMSYQKILEIISKFENIRNIKKLVEKPRLKIFKEITGDNDDNYNDKKRRLLDDIKGIDIFWKRVI